MKRLMVSGVLVGALAAAVGCGSKSNADVSNNRQVSNTNQGKLTALKGTLGEIKTLAPRGPAGTLGEFTTVADISYVVPCWAKLQEGFPKTAVSVDRTTGVTTISFQALALDQRAPGQASCRGLRLETLEDVFVGAGVIGEPSIVLKNLGVKDKLD